MKHSLSRSQTRLLYMGRLLPRPEQATSGCTAGVGAAVPRSRARFYLVAPSRGAEPAGEDEAHNQVHSKNLSLNLGHFKQISRPRLLVLRPFGAHLHRHVNALAGQPPCQRSRQEQSCCGEKLRLL